MIEPNFYLEKINKASLVTSKKIEGYVQVLKQWSIIEETYSKGYEKLIASIAKNHEENELVECISKLFSLLHQKSNIFLEKLKKTEIVLCDFVKFKSSFLNVKYIRGINICNEIKNLHSCVVESINAYHASLLECDKTAVKLDEEPCPANKKKIIKKLAASQKNLKEKITIYQQYYSKYIKKKAQYSSEIKKIMETYSFQEKKTIECYEKSLELVDYYFHHNFSVLSSKEMLSSKRKSEILEYSIEELDLPEICIEKYLGSHPLFINFNKNSSRFSFLQTSDIEKLDNLTENFYKDDLEAIIEKAWNDEDLSCDDYILFNSQIKTQLGRKAWIFVLNKRRNLGKFSLRQKSLKTTGELLTSVLNECERTNDIDTAKALIVLSQTFYSENNLNKNYLQVLINKHSLWRNSRFWIAAIEKNIVEEISKFENCSENFKENKENNFKTLVFCQLISFGNIMSEFDFSSEEIKKIIYFFTDKHNFSDFETDEIIRIINSSIILSD